MLNKSTHFFQSDFSDVIGRQYKERTNSARSDGSTIIRCTATKLKVFCGKKETTHQTFQNHIVHALGSISVDFMSTP